MRRDDGPQRASTPKASSACRASKSCTTSSTSTPMPRCEGYPTWRRSYPEDPKIDYLRRVEKLIAWRDQHAPGKEIRDHGVRLGRLDKARAATGTFSKWVGSTETQQAQYLVRSFLLFSKLDVARAYIFLLRRQGRTAGSRLIRPDPQWPAETSLPRGRPPLENARRLPVPASRRRKAGDRLRLRVHPRRRPKPADLGGVVALGNRQARANRLENRRHEALGCRAHAVVVRQRRRP